MPAKNMPNGINWEWHQVVGDGTNDAGKPVASGLYFYRLTAEKFGQTKRMMFMR